MLPQHKTTYDLLVESHNALSAAIAENSRLTKLYTAELRESINQSPKARNEAKTGRVIEFMPPIRKEVCRG